MALRTFRSNPALGGFGNESTTHLLLRDGTVAVPQKGDGDAFAQIVKELVDNAIDACSNCAKRAKNLPPQRVRVEIQSFEKHSNPGSEDEYDPDSDDDNSIDDSNSILRVTVVDNGCGMNDIKACVDPFHTSKAHATQDTATRRTRQSNEKGDNSVVEAETAGRYGIGLTLCLLHAQRLVPGSCASIRSARNGHPHWTSVRCVIDTKGDSVKCIPSAPIAKAFPEESGTAVSLLVPGGASATIAWPRLAEYFARFKLSLGMECSLEVLAPTLSRVPLCIRSVDKNGVSSHNEQHEATRRTSEETEDTWSDGFDIFVDSLTSQQQTAPTLHDDSDNRARSASNTVDPGRLAIWKAAQLYLGRSFALSDVAHAIVPIRLPGSGKGCTRSSSNNGPTLEIDVLVHGPDDDEGGASLLDKNSEENDGFQDSRQERTCASMVLVRMVNRIPLLDSSEAAACGLVQGVPAKKRMWNSFGLDVTHRHDSSNVAKLLTFEVRDSEQVAPFFQAGNHSLLQEENPDNESENGEDVDPGIDCHDLAGGKRHREVRKRNLLPASLRLGNILVIVQIHAQPSNLPLPTLSKGRLPVDNVAIDDALEVALTKCMRQLQQTNPKLLLTASELRDAERDARYIPAISSSLASILCKSTNSMGSLIGTVQGWRNTNVCDSASQIESSIENIGNAIEGRLRMVLSNNGKKRSRKKRNVVTRETSKADMPSDDCELENFLYPVSLLAATVPEQSSGDESEKDDFEDW